MSTTLTINNEASFPDRGAAGLHIAFATGNEGAYLLHELPTDAPVLHVRFAFAPATASGGTVRIAGGHDAEGVATWWLEFDAEQRQVQLVLASGQTIAATLNALPWHCVEVGVDTAAGVARLWINGLEHGAVYGTFDDLCSRTIWLGGVFKDTHLTGAMYIDEWVMGESYIGPVRVDPSSRHADAPSRWLVIYNTNVPDSVVWAEAYRQARNVPFANLLGLPLPTDETIDSQQYADLAATVNGYLASSGLVSQVMGVLVGFGVPGYVDFGAGHINAVPALMHSEHLDGTPLGNAAVADASPRRPTWADMAGRRMTARLDAPTLAEALELIERADVQITDGLTKSSEAKLWFDPFAGEPGSVYEWWRQQMVGWARSFDRQRLRLTMAVSGDLTDPGQPEASFTSISDDAFYWGWSVVSSPAPPSDFFAEPAGPRVCSLQLSHLSATATTLRSSTPTNWVDTAIKAGYAAAVGSSRPYSLSNTSYVRPFFDALRRGWTLAEAWYVALPVQREGQHLVGDPLLRTRFPAAGWDVFGPARQLEHLDAQSPTAALPLHKHEYPLVDATALPDDGDEAVYLVRRRDDQGRTEGGLAMTRVVRDGAVFRRPAMPPLWPERAGWRVRVEQGQVHLAVMWDRPLPEARVAAAGLLVEADGAAEVELAVLDLADGHVSGDAAALLSPEVDAVQATVPLPTQQARYRWRYVSDDGVVQHTPHSAWVRPTVMSEEPLTVWEA